MPIVFPAPCMYCTSTVYRANYTLCRTLWYSRLIVKKSIDFLLHLPNNLCNFELRPCPIMSFLSTNINNLIRLYPRLAQPTADHWFLFVSRVPRELCSLVSDLSVGGEWKTLIIFFIVSATSFYSTWPFVLSQFHKLLHMRNYSIVLYIYSTVLSR